MVLGLTACQREPALDPPAKVQVVCAPTTTPSATPMLFVLDTGDRSVRWANGPGAPTGALTIEDHQYVLRFGRDEPASWRATLNRYDGTMLRELGKPGPTQTQQRLTCRRDAEGPKL